MIIENKTTEIGDIILIKAEIPIIGLIALQDFYDNTLGEDGNKYFDRQFCYSIDGINYTNWIELNPTNLQNVQIQSSDTFFIQYKYERRGTDSSGDLSFINNTLEADILNPSCGITFNKTFFSQFFTCYDLKVLNWCLSVTEKMYKPGFVPKYIERGRFGNYNREDEDYIAFWRSICCVFAVIVNYARLFENVTGNRKILETFLENEDINFFANTTDIIDLLFLLQNYYSEITKRGTINIIQKKSEGASIDGELLRLIGWVDGVDEFLFSLSKKEKVGWIIDKSSPIYKGTYFEYMLNKAYEKTQNFVDLTKYPIINPSYCSIYTDGNKNVLKIDGVPNLTVSGILESSIPTSNFGISIDVNLDYEITFWVKQPILSPTLGFQILGVDINNNIIPLLRIDSLSPSPFLFQQQQLLKNDKYYFIRSIIYNINHPSLTTEESKLNIGFGNNLKFSNKNIVKIFPFVYVNNITSTPNLTYIWDFKIRPLNTPYSTGFIQINNLIKVWLKNNNLSLSQFQLEGIMRDKLIPYNSSFKNTFLNNLINQGNINQVLGYIDIINPIYLHPNNYNIVSGSRYLVLESPTMNKIKYWNGSNWINTTEEISGNIVFDFSSKIHYIYNSDISFWNIYNLN